MNNKFPIKLGGVDTLDVSKDYQKNEDNAQAWIVEVNKVDNPDSGEYCSLIRDGQFDKTYGRIMSIIEGLGLPEKQELAVKKQIRNTFFSITDDAEALHEDSVYLMRKAGVIFHVFLGYKGQ